MRWLQKCIICCTIPVSYWNLDLHGPIGAWGTSQNICTSKKWLRLWITSKMCVIHWPKEINWVLGVEHVNSVWNRHSPSCYNKTQCRWIAGVLADILQQSANGGNGGWWTLDDKSCCSGHCKILHWGLSHHWPVGGWANTIVCASFKNTAFSVQLVSCGKSFCNSCIFQPSTCFSCGRNW